MAQGKCTECGEHREMIPVFDMREIDGKIARKFRDLCQACYDRMEKEAKERAKNAKK